MGISLGVRYQPSSPGTALAAALKRRLARIVYGVIRSQVAPRSSYFISLVLVPRGNCQGEVQTCRESLEYRLRVLSML